MGDCVAFGPMTSCGYFKFLSAEIIICLTLYFYQIIYKDPFTRHVRAEFFFVWAIPNSSVHTYPGRVFMTIMFKHIWAAFKHTKHYFTTEHL